MKIGNAMTWEEREIDAIVAALARWASGDSGSLEAISATWRLAGIQSSREAESWIHAGVFDGHRAGVLRLAGIMPEDIAGLMYDDERSLGFAFAMGQIGVVDVREAIFADDAAPDITLIRPLGSRKPSTRPLPPGDR